jgi:hypothetical protein
MPSTGDRLRWDILCYDVPVICCSIYAMIRLILLILYVTSCISAFRCLIGSKDPWTFGRLDHLITISLRPFPLYQFLSVVSVTY